MIILLKFVLFGAILDKTIRNLIQFDSEIHLVVHGEGKHYFLYKNYWDNEHLKVISNGEEINNPLDLGEDKNNIILKFSGQIEDCKGMFAN